MHPPTVTQGYVDPAGNGRPALRWGLNPSPIGGSLAQIAQIAEITGDVDPALRWDVYPPLIGGSLAETAETPAKSDDPKKDHLAPRGAAQQEPCF